MKKDVRPPRWADKFLEWYCAPPFIEEIQGDLHESYHRRLVEKGKFVASLFFILDVFRSLSVRTINWQALNSRCSMNLIRSNITATRRKVERRKAFFVINVVGLATSFAAAILIFMYVSHELSFDNFHTKGDRIYRVYCAYAKPGDSIREFPYTPPIFAPVIKKEISGIESIARFSKIYSAITIKHQDKVFNESEVYRADSAVFNIFTFQFLKGNPQKALAEPRSAVLTRSTAIKYFGSLDQAFNQTIEVDTDQTKLYQVTGIVEDIPANSHYSCKVLLSFNYGKESFHTDNWLAHDPVTYVLASESSNPADLELSVKRLVEKILDPIHLSRFGESYDTRKAKGALQEYRLQPLNEVHLYSHHMGETGNIVYIYLFSAIGIMLIFIACFNYINLSTARMTWEARGASIRKVLGATRIEVRSLLLTESILVALIASFAAIILVQIFLNVNSPISFQFAKFSQLRIETIILPIGLAVIAGFLSGLIPSKLIDTIDSTKVLRGQFTHGTKGSRLRQLFVGFQFTVSLGLIICTFLITQQLSYLQRKSLGFDKENLLVVNNISKLGDKAATLKKILANESFVVQSALCYNRIGEPHNFAAFTPVELIDQGREDLVVGIPVFVGDEDYLKTLGVDLLMGHPFPDGLDQKNQQIILNREALRAVGWQDRKSEDLIGKSIDVNGLRYELAGVVEDYHFLSLHQELGPMSILSHYYSGYESLMLRIKPNAYNEAIERIKTAWNKIASDVPFDYYFLNDDLERLYASERNVEMIFKGFAFIAILIACLGLLGLSMFSVERRTKEIGIRKVVGATVSSIVLLLTQNVVKLILLSFVIASPLAWYFITQWLDNFAYKIDISLSTFVVAGGMTLTIALITIGFQSINASIANPVKSLKYE